MAGKLRNSGKGRHSKEFRRSHALIIGINDYGNGIRPLATPVNDATRLAQLLQEEHGYENVRLLTRGVTRGRLEALLTQELPSQIDKHDRLLLYFAGHGIALDGDDGPQGFLVPQDASASDRESLLPMTQLHSWLDALACRHMLAILDCCFAGAFRWASTRRLDTAALEVIHQERYERFLRSPAWQVLTSAAYDQEALDLVAGQAVGERGVREESGSQHSPFALALYDALRGEGDLIPKGGGDGVITATELYLYLREQVEVGVGVEVGHDQTPGLWPLNRHDRGEYVFLAPGHQLNLPPAPKLTYELNPWRGLESYESEHGPLFFGREEEVQELALRVQEQPLTAVLGASGTGKSSLVKAGLLPRLKREANEGDEGLDDECSWLILPPLRPGATPLSNLHRLLTDELACYATPITEAQLSADNAALAGLVADWRQDHLNSRLLLVVDQLEELVTLADDEEQAHFLGLLAQTIEQHPDAFCLIVTLRTDFEPQFDTNTPLAPLWQDARYVVPPLDQADLRQVIEGPASVRVLYFDPPDLVDALITEVNQTPGALPLLSFALSEMYIHYLNSRWDDRALTKEDYDALGGVIGSLRNRANAEYDTLPDDAHRQTMRRVMLRMISVEGGELARRRIHRSELVYTDDEENRRVNTVLACLVEARLLVTGEEQGEATYEPAHDALVLAWDRLLRWKKAAEQYLPLQRRLAQAATEWYGTSPEIRSGLLWDDDPRLPQLEETLWPTRVRRNGLGERLRRARQVMLPNTDTPPDTRWLNQREVAFTQASVWARSGFWLRVVGITAAVIIALAALAFFATLQANEATIAQATAEAEATRAVAAEGIAQVESTRAIEQQNIAEAESTRAIEQQSIAEAESTRAIEQANLAATRQAEAERQARIAKARALAAQSVEAADRNFKESLLLAVRAVSVTLRNDGRAVNEAYRVLYRTLASDRGYSVALGHAVSVESAAFSPDGERVLTTGCEEVELEFAIPGFYCTSFTARLWDAETSALLAILEAHTHDVRVAAFSSNGERVVTAGCDERDGNGFCTVHTARLWDAETGTLLTILEGHTAQVISATFSHDGERMVTASSDGTARMWNVASEPLGDGSIEPIAVLGEHTNWISSAAFSPDGERVITTGCETDETGNCTVGIAQLWDAQGEGSGDLLISLGGYSGILASAAFSPDGERVITTGCETDETGDCTVGIAQLWDVETGALLGILEGHTHDVKVAAFSSNGERLVTAGCDERDDNGFCTVHTARLWDAEGDAPGDLIAVLERDTLPVSSTMFSPDGQRVVTTSSGNTARLWDAETGALLADLEGHIGGVSSVAFSPDGQRLVTAGCDEVGSSFSCTAGTARLWDAGTGTLLNILEGQIGRVLSATFSPDGERVITTNCETDEIGSCTAGTARLWGLENLLAVLGEHTGAVSSAVFSPDAERVVTASCDERDDNGSCTKYTVRPSGAEDDGSEDLVTVLEGHAAWVNSATFSPDGEHVVTTGCDESDRMSCVVNTARLWNAKTGALLTVLEGHTDQVESAAFSPDGELVVTTSDDGTARIWDVSGNLLSVLEGHTSPVSTAAFSSDGERVTTVSTDGTTRVWVVGADSLLTEARHQLFPMLTVEECKRYFPEDCPVDATEVPLPYAER